MVLSLYAVRVHGRPHIGLNPPHSTKRTHRGCYRLGHHDKDGEDDRKIRIQFFIGAAKRMLQSGGLAFWVNVRPLCFPSHNITVKHGPLR